MDMGEVKFRGDPFTWVNNRDGEDFIQEKLDRFLGSAQLMVQCDTTKILHVTRQALDHSLLVLDTKPQRAKTRLWFIFYSKWAKMQGAEKLVNDTWEKPIKGSRMFKVSRRLSIARSSSQNRERLIKRMQSGN